MKYLDDIKFSIDKKDHEIFIKDMKEIKELLIASNLLPVKFSLYKDEENDKNTFTLHIFFPTDPSYDEWFGVVKLNVEVMEIFNKYVDKVKGSNWSKEIF